VHTPFGSLKMHHLPLRLPGPVPTTQSPRVEFLAASCLVRTTPRMKGYLLKYRTQTRNCASEVDGLCEAAASMLASSEIPNATPAKRNALCQTFRVSCRQNGRKRYQEVHQLKELQR